MKDGDVLCPVKKSVGGIIKEMTGSQRGRQRSYRKVISDCKKSSGKIEDTVGPCFSNGKQKSKTISLSGESLWFKSRSIDNNESFDEVLNRVIR